MSLIHLNSQARENYFRKLVVTNILDDSYSAGEVKHNSRELSLTPLFHTSPPQINYSELNAEVYIENLNKQEVNKHGNF